MSHDAVLSVLVKVDGIAATIAQVDALERNLEGAGTASDALGSKAAKAAQNVDKLGSEVDQAAKAAKSATAEVDKASKAAGTLSDKAADAGRSTAAMGNEASAARGHVAGLAQDVQTATKATDLHRDAQGRWRNSAGQFASVAEKAAAGVDNLGNSFDGFSGKKRKADDLIDKNVRVFGAFSSVVRTTSQVVTALGGGFGPLMSALVLAAPLLLALVGASIALISALGPLVGLAAAAGVGLAAFGQAAGVAALASMGVADAVKEQMDATGKAGKSAQSGADQQRAAARAIQQAQEGVRQAYERVTAATEQFRQAQQAEKDALAAIGPARQKAARDLQDMRSNLVGAQLDEQRAVIGLLEARKALADATKPADITKITEAESALTNAELNQQRAVRGLTDAQQKLKDLLKPADALTVADAQDQVADSIRDQTRAQLDLGKAQAASDAVNQDPQATDAARAQAALDLADAQNAIGDAARGRQHAEEALAKLQAGPDPQEVAKAQLDVAQAQQAVTDATSGTAKAQQDLAKATQSEPDPTEVAKAQLAVAEAQHTLTDAVRDRVRLERDLAAAEKAGISGSDGVVAAEKRAADAHQQVTDAQRQLDDANRDVAKSLQAVKDAQTDAASSAAATAAANVDLNQKFNSLPPAAQAFVRELISLKPKLDELRATAASGLFPGVIDGMKAAMGSFGSVKKVVGETSGVLGGLASRAGELVGSSAFGKDIETIGHRNAIVIDRLGGAALYVADMIRHLLVAAGPLTTWLAKVTEQWAHSADAAVRSGRESGALAAFFQKTRNTIITVVSILANLGSAFFNVGKAAAPFGRDMLKSIDAVTGRFADWTKSVGGQQTLQKFFREATQLAKQLAPALGSVAGSLGGMAFRVLPAYIKILNALGPLAGPLVQAFVLWKLALTGVTIATTAVTAAEKAWIVATKLATAAQWLLNAAMDANPIGLVVIAIAALVAGIILAWKHSETFRTIVTDTWHAIESVAKPVIDWLAEAVPKVWDAIKTGAQAVLDFLKDHWQLILAILTGPIGLFVDFVATNFGTIIGLFTALPGGIKDAVIALPGALLDTGKWLLDRIIDGFKLVATGIKNAAKWLLDQAVDLIKAEINGYKAVGSWVLDRIVDGLKVVTDLLKTVGSWVVGKIEGLIKAEVGAATAVGSWIVDRVADGFTTVTDALGKVGDWLSKNLGKIFDGAKGAFTGLGSTLIDWVVDGFKAGVGKLAGFAKSILDIVGKIPGVGGVADKGKEAIDKVTKSIGLARGGAFGATGGLIDKPMVFMGEEAPRHPEFVIPTNPAYRGRAQGLLMQAAGALGFANGGVWSEDQIQNLATQHHMQDPRLMAAIAMAESSGRLDAFGPPSGRGLWQIEWNVWASKMRSLGLTNPDDPNQNAEMAKVILAQQGLGAWVTYNTGAYKQFLSGDGGGIIGKIGDALSGALDLLKNGASALLGKLPGTDSLGWLSGLGDYAISHVTDWIKDKASSLIPGGGSGGGSLTTSGPNGVGSFRGFPMANWVIESLKHAESVLHRVLQPTSGWRSQEQQDAIRARDPRAAKISEHLGTQYPHGAVDFGGFNDAAAKAIKMAVVQATADFKYPLLPPNGFVDDGHASGTGYAMGGAWGGLPFIGTYHEGGFAPREGLAHVAAGEEMVPAGKRPINSSGPLVHVEHMTVNSEADLDKFARSLGWQLK